MSWFIQTLTNMGITKIPTTFVETGAYLGEGIERYIQEPHFINIHSIELSEKWYNYCKEKFSNNSNVQIHLGNSFIVIKDLIDAREPVLWYLDAHFSGGETAGADIENGCPLIKELETILDRHNLDDIIVIDDMQLMGKASMSGIENDKIYPLTYFDFRHASIENIFNVFNERKIQFLGAFCSDFDRLVLTFY